MLNVLSFFFIDEEDNFPRTWIFVSMLNVLSFFFILLSYQLKQCD